MNRSFAEMLHGVPIDLEEVERVSEALIFERVWRGSKFFKFACLLVLAASIATFGLLGDSVAVIIGAMIVAFDATDHGFGFQCEHRRSE